MIDRVHWIDKDKLIRFILDCQVSSQIISFVKINTENLSLYNNHNTISYCKYRIRRKVEFQIDQMMLLTYFILTLELQVIILYSVIVF